MSNCSIIKLAFQEQARLHSLGFVTWYGKVCELAAGYNIDIQRVNYSKFDIKGIIRSAFI